MKFGATLSRRSVPQWRTHDLDYDEIKILIKQQTSSKEGCSREFEKSLLIALDSELERVHSSEIVDVDDRLMNSYDVKLEKLRDDYLLVNELSKPYPERRGMIQPTSKHPT
jgi:SPX domain protein involved in polyphosphate accumulation